MRWLVMDLILTAGIVPGIEAGATNPMLQGLVHYLQWMDSEMAGCELAAGDAFSAADVMVAYALEIANGRGHMANAKNLASYLQRITLRDAYQLAKRKAAA